MSSTTSFGAEIDSKVTESEKDWDLDWKFIDQATHKEVINVLESLEEAFYLKGKPEAKEYLVELTKSTGFLYAYKVLLEEQKDLTLDLELLQNDPSGEFKHYDKMLEAKKRIAIAQTKNKKVFKDDPNLTDDHRMALSLYTAECCYHVVNRALRTGGVKGAPPILLKWTMFISSFIQGFRILPSFWGRVYRGSKIVTSDFVEGKVLIFESFTSTSRSEEQALKFMRRKAPPGVTVPPEAKFCLLVIHSLSGRQLDDISFYPSEAEVVFRPFTSFLVQRITPIDDYVRIEMKESHADTRGRKVLIWVDDKHGEESKMIMDICEKSGVTCVHKTSTKETLEFISTQKAILKRDLTRLRIITDMVRDENGQPNIEAGLDLVKGLAKHGYREQIVVFTGIRYLHPNRKKFVDADLNHVFVTATRSDAQRFAKFEDLLGTQSSVTFKSSPSSSHLEGGGLISPTVSGTTPLFPSSS